ncbi:hypothetical protein [Microbacterium sp. K35]|uniref:hypothetical protein n=1 Tax=Microbacterium sp. K35 TaxID=2305440 RepID=UPI001443FD44|nr:hypothetical protein [Microbacterium sp. K35]
MDYGRVWGLGSLRHTCVKPEHARAELPAARVQDLGRIAARLQLAADFRPTK